MGKRRRYDTEALVGQLKAERRTGIILSLAGVFILFFLVTLAVLGIDGEEDTANPSATASATGAAKGAGTSPEPVKSTGEADKKEEERKREEPPEEKTPAAAEEKEPEGPAKVELVLNRKGVVWLDRKKIGRFKKKSIKLKPGSHHLRAKVGRRTLKTTLEIKGGESLEVSFDGRRRRVKVKPK